MNILNIDHDLAKADTISFIEFPLYNWISLYNKVKKEEESLFHSYIWKQL